jgi:hypothetical protein
MVKYLVIIYLIILILFSLFYYSTIEGLTSNNDDLTINKPTTKSSSSLISYDSNNYNMQYHEDASLLPNSPIQPITYNDNQGNVITVQSTAVQGTTTYYKPGSYLYGASSYVPNYEDSIYLSKTT